jgi:hypothetical protein
MSYEFKRLSDTEVVATVGDSASILIEENGVIKRAPKDEIGGGIKVASTAEVGQTIVVKAVDENGNPTEWECADVASGGSEKAYFVDLTTIGTYYGNEELYNYLLEKYNNPAQGFPNVIIKGYMDTLDKLISFLAETVSGRGCIRIYCGREGSMYTICATQSDANSVENSDMA